MLIKICRKQVLVTGLLIEIVEGLYRQKAHLLHADIRVKSSRWTPESKFWFIGAMDVSITSNLKLTLEVEIRMELSDKDWEVSETNISIPKSKSSIRLIRTSSGKFVVENRANNQLFLESILASAT